MRMFLKTSHLDYFKNFNISSYDILGIGERWSMISRCIEERLEFLHAITAILECEEYLASYLDTITCSLKQMENEMDLDAGKIQAQHSKIKVRTSVNTIY